MPKFGPFRLLTIGTFAALLVLSACSSDDASESAPTPTPTPTAQEILVSSSEAMLAIESVGFSIEHDGEPPVIDASTNTKFISVSGFFQAPDTVQATVRADTLLGVQDLGIVWSPAGNSMTIPGLGQTAIPDGLGFNPITIFGAEGLSDTLAMAIVDPILLGEESLDGVPTYHLTGTASGETLSAYTAGTVIVSDLGMDLQINRETFQVVRITLTEQSGDTWLIELFSYNEEVVG